MKLKTAIDEVWKDIPKYRGLYQASNTGEIKSLERIIKCNYKSGVVNRKVGGVILKPSINTSGYEFLILYKNKIPKNHDVHKLIAITFLNHKPNGHSVVIDHINNNPSDNRVENLQIITHRENCSKDRSGKYPIGVTFDKNRNTKPFVAQIYIDGRHIRIGRYDTIQEASDAYQHKLKQI